VAYDHLPEEVRSLADRNFRLLRQDAFHPSLHFKQVRKYWSVRVGLGYRALAVRKTDDLIWFWIGPHSEYNRLIR
jgi:hypothetical protein